MVLDRMVVYKLDLPHSEHTLDQESDIHRAWIREIGMNVGVIARIRIWAGTALIKAGTALRAPAMPEFLAVSSPCDSD